MISLQPGEGIHAAGLELFSTSPQSKDVSARDYRTRVADVARWSEDADYHGILVYTDNQLVDPWLVAQLIIGATERLCPLVAVQPVYMHPYSVAKMVASLGHLYERRLYLNIVAGGFRNDLLALGDPTPHDERYERAIEYTLIVKELLAGRAVTRSNGYYDVRNLRLSPRLASDLMPGILISGSSPAGLAAAEAIGATAVKYPKPPGEEQPTAHGKTRAGIRVGVIARADDDAAWAVAHARFPEDRKGQITHELAMKTSDSHWHRELSDRDGRPATGVYWLGPFENYKTFCPYLVGSYDAVAHELAEYLRVGFRTFILDIPPDREELDHTRIAFEAALARVPLTVTAAVLDASE